MRWTWDVDPVLLPGGPFPLRTYGLCVALSMALGLLTWRWQMLRAGHSEALAGRFAGYALAAYIIGARLGHCLFYDFDYCFDPPYRVLLLWQGGMASHGTLVSVVVVLMLFARANRLSAIDLADRLSFSAAIGATLIRIGNLFNSEVVGRRTDGSWGVRFPRYDRVAPAHAPLRHPSQLYEAALGAAVLSVLLAVDRRYGEDRPRGLLAALFCTLYFAGRFAVEYTKAHQALAPTAALTMGQWLSLPPLAAGIAGLLWLRRDARA